MAAKLALGYSLDEIGEMGMVNSAYKAPEVDYKRIAYICILLLSISCKRSLNLSSHKKTNLTKSKLLSGGNMGVEGSVVTVVVCATAAAVILLMARRRGMLLAPRWRRPAPAEDGVVERR